MHNNDPVAAPGRRLKRCSRFVDTANHDNLDNTIFAHNARESPVFQPIPWVNDSDVPEELNLDLGDPVTPRGRSIESVGGNDVPVLLLGAPWRRTAAFRVERIIAEVGFSLLNLN